MIRYSKYHAWFCLFLVLLMTLVQPLAVFADVITSSNAFVVNPNYLIGSASNVDPYGIATMELTDEDYDIQPFSSLGSVNNTVDWDSSCLDIIVYDESAGGYIFVKPDSLSYSTSGGIDFSTILESDQHLFYIDYVINRVPSPGVYSFSFDFGSDFSVDYLTVQFISRKNSASVQTVESGIFANVVEESGDFYFAPSVLEVGNCSEIIIRVRLTDSMDPLSGIHSYGGTFKASFVRSDGDPVFSTVNPEYGSMDYETDVSGSLSDISSSIGDMSSSMDSASESLEYISTSQNLIIQGIDNVIMHISDQLYAFWDQLYNLIHEPTYARLGDILDAIRNLDLEITVEMKEVTDAVNKMNQDMQGKLQNVQQTLTGGYDSSSMDSDNQELNSSLNEYEAAENELFDDAKENINSFEFDTDLGEFSTPLTDISYFLGSLFVGLGPMNVVISFSLTLTIAMVLIGWYRFKGGS